MIKTVILCGGRGTRLSEETVIRPKPMVEIGERPILWHIMNLYGKQGYRDFCLALGYKGHWIKEYFLNYRALNSDFRVDLKTGEVSHYRTSHETNEAGCWTADLIDTGLDTSTGGRLKRLEKILRPHGTFMLTYGDGLSNVDVNQLLDFHRSHKKIATITAVKPSARFGGLVISDHQVKHFIEKPQSGEGWINGGFFVFEPEIFDYIAGDDTILEHDPMDRLVKEGQLMSYQHTSFWQCMDTLREKEFLQTLWESGKAPWR